MLLKSLICFPACFLPDWVKDLSAPRYTRNPRQIRNHTLSNPDKEKSWAKFSNFIHTPKETKREQGQAKYLVQYVANAIIFF